MLEQNIVPQLAQIYKVKPSQIEATIQLLDEDNTIPFIARYRKEMTGELKDEQIRSLQEQLLYWRNLIKRQQEIINNITEQGKMTAELLIAIENVDKLQELEDLYLPYKQKKRTRASIAKEDGLEPLANIIWEATDYQGELEDFAREYLCENRPEVADVLAGAADIIAEQFSDDATIRASLRKFMWEHGILETKREAANDEQGIFLMYEEYTEPVRRLPSHRILAINRGEKKDILKVKISTPIDEDYTKLQTFMLYESVDRYYHDFIMKAAIDAYKRLIEPALERETRNRLTEDAESQAIKVFGSNLKQLLLQPPLLNYTVMGLDPGYRTGCKMAIVDPTGQILTHDVLYITHSEKQQEQARKKFINYVQKYHVNLLSIGNGTASYETEEFVSKIINEEKLDVQYLITNEAGASVYSASKLAVEELPDYDVTVRGAVSIARRVQDPLAELVKIEPKAIGVGQYQHDVNQKELDNTLTDVVEVAVNHVGVELNTASAALLKYISGINASVATNIIKYRDEHGSFASRQELLKVKRLGPSTFTQCAGFIRINQAANPLDNTPVHPESYAIAELLLERADLKLTDLNNSLNLPIIKQKLAQIDLRKFAQEVNAGEPTVRDIVDALVRPGRDPREDLPQPLVRQNIVKLEDIQVGSIVRGTVRNITDFGVFVDFGIKTAGLIHISELSTKRVHHPLDVVSVGDIVDAVVINVDSKRGRIGLSIKQLKKETKL